MRSWDPTGPTPPAPSTAVSCDGRTVPPPGDRWLVAPVMTPDDAKTVELPAGKWRDDLGNGV